MAEMYGFIYKATNLATGRWYVGKKAYSHKIKVKVGKKERKRTGKRVKYIIKDSGYKEYLGSSEELKKDIEKLGRVNFRREILRECPDRISLSYWEQCYLFTLGAIFENSYNSNLGGHFYRGKVSQ